MTRVPETPWIVDLKRNSLDDGPGIRTVVFFKGCPLRCVWCQNPETVAPLPVLQRTGESCLSCGACVAACPQGRARPAREKEPEQIDCTRCGSCVEACPSGSRRIAGEQCAPEVLEQRLLRDQVFYRRSGGGVTLSGGEPALFTEYVGEVARRLRARDVHVLIETCGQFEWSAFSKHLLPHLSTLYFDLKLADPDRHRKWVGRDNETIHENFRRVASEHPDVLPRIPLVPGLTDDEENLSALAELVRSVGLRRLALLPYNPLWVNKRKALGLELPYAHEGWMSKAEVLRCEAVVTRRGLTVVH